MYVDQKGTRRGQFVNLFTMLNLGRCAKSRETYQTSHRPSVYSRVVSDIGERRKTIKDGLRRPSMQRSVQVLRSFGTEKCYRNLVSDYTTLTVIGYLPPDRLSLRAYRPASHSPQDSQGQLGILEASLCDAAGLE